MSTAGEEDDDEEEVRYHDSLDRILSSSNTSYACSRSNSDHDASNPKCSSDYDGAVPKFPMGVSRNYDVWISQPSSVEERRPHLLFQMGLTGDPSLSLSLSCHHFSPSDDIFCGTNNSTSKVLDSNSDYINSTDGSSNCNGRAFVMVRSKSDGDCGSRKTFSDQSNNSVTGGFGVVLNNVNDPNIQRHCCMERSGSSGQSPASCTVSPSKPPKVNIKMDDSKSNGSFSSIRTPLTRNEELGGSLGCNGPDDVNAVCVIKNLDNGKEFMVNEMRGDGTWNQIKELGTGRQLTMEEFTSEMCVGTSPIVQELMRRENVEGGNKEGLDPNAGESRSKLKKRGSWLRSIKNVANSVTGHKERRSSDERVTLSEKGGRRSSSATDESQDVSCYGPERVRVKHYGKSIKELTALYKCQEIQAHSGSIWAIKFSFDGKYLATAGEDCVIQVWQVMETERKGDFFSEKSEDENLNLIFLVDHLIPCQCHQI